MAETSPNQFVFGAFTLDLENRVLRYGKQRVDLTPRAFDVLLVLVEHAGQVIDAKQLLGRVWPGTFVGQATLTQNIYTIRKALERHAADEVYIETLPRRGYRFVAPVTGSARPDGDGSGTAVRNVAVLPFVSLGGHDLDPFVGLGLADAVITSLGGLRSVTVRPTSAVSQFTGKDANAIEAGRALGVDAVLEGRLQTVEGRLRATLQLVRLRDLVTVWADSSDFDTSDPLAIQGDLARSVAERLPAQLGQASSETRLRPTTGSIEAHQAYVKGRYHWNLRSLTGLRQAIDCFEDAVRRDGRYALAHAGLADCYALLPLYGDDRPRDAFPHAKAAAARALELDPQAAEAHTSLAYSLLFYDWRWADAEASFSRAIELNVGYSTAHHWASFLHSALGRHDSAVASGMRAVELDPLSLAINSDLGLVLYFARRYEEATAQFRLTLELGPDFAYANFGLALALTELGHHDEAAQEAARAVELSLGSSTMLAVQGHVHARAQRRQEALEILEQLGSLSGAAEQLADRRALVSCGLGDTERALEELGRACDERSRFVVFLGVWPVFDRLRAEPGFAELTRRVGGCS